MAEPTSRAHVQTKSIYFSYIYPEPEPNPNPSRPEDSPLFRRHHRRWGRKGKVEKEGRKGPGKERGSTASSR